MQYCIDYLYFDRGRIQIRGWAAPEKQDAPVTVELLREDGQKEEMHMERNLRQDVHEYLYHARGKEAYGFLITLKGDTGSPLYLHAFPTEETGDPGIRIELRRLYRHQNSLLSFLRSGDKKGFLLRRKYGDLQPEDLRYNVWYQAHRATKKELQEQRKTHFPKEPRISVLVPVYRPKMDQFEAMVRSVTEQTYGNWELCFANGSPEEPEITKRLRELSEADPRIRVETLRENRGISANTNACLSMARGEYIALLDQDDLYEPNALYEFVKAVNEQPEAELLYSDEDKIDDETGAHLTPHFKPDYSPARMHSDNYICHLIMIRTELARKTGGERTEYDGAQDFDFTLRCLEERTPGSPVVHIPKILYNWRIHAASTAGGMQAKTYAVDAGARAIQASYERQGFRVEMIPSKFSGRYITVPILSEKPPVSVLIPNKDHAEDLRRCVDSLLRRTSYGNFEILILENNSKEEETFACYRELEERDPRIRVLHYRGEFNFAKINNFGAAEAKGDYLLLLNNDTEVPEAADPCRDFISSMVFYASQPGVGAVGARLLYDDDTIQHAGVVVGVEGRVIHICLGMSKEEPGYMGRLVSSCDVSAVTGACLMSRRDVYRQVDGMTESFTVAYNDVDYCLKVRQAGLSVVFDAYAELYHYESRSRGYEDTEEKKARLQKEFDLLRERWPEALLRDPFYNDNLSLRRGSYLLP